MMCARPATAIPLTEQDYLSFNTSTRNRAKAEKRFSRAIQIVYGNQELFKNYFGSRGSALKQVITLRSSRGSITFRGTGNQNITSLDLNQNARVGKDIFKVVVDNASCQIRKKAPEPCQAEIRVIKGRTSISDRIIATGSNGIQYDSGSIDVSSGWIVFLSGQSKN